ncbi:MAG: hypothetical protein NTV06_01425 [candidate division Zixibacteria bacterium]|nr:hypothetical protein [candidate division Zixibacteria bacterium]
MIFRVRWPFLLMAIFTVLAAGVVTAAVFTDFFNLKTVKIEPADYTQDLSKLHLTLGRNIFAVPITDAIVYLLSNPNVFRVEANYDLPDGIIFKVNHIKPVALMLGEDGRTIFGLDERCRPIPVEQSTSELELPLITGLRECVLYQKVTDERVGLILRQLNQLKQDHGDFYQIISSIDLAGNDSVILYMDGIPFQMVMYAGQFYKRVEELRQFLLGFKPDLNQIKKIDLRTEGQIIATRKKCQKPE